MKIKVLHVFKNMNPGGAETLIMNVFRNMDRNRIQFDFLLTSNEEGAYCKEIRDLGGNIYKLDSFSNKHPFKNILNVIDIIRKNGNYDFIHLPMMFYSGWLCLAAYIAGIPNRIVHSHNANEDTNSSIFRKIYIVISRFLINKFSTIKISCGQRARNFLFGRNKKIIDETIILHNGIDITKFQNVSNKEVENLKYELGIDKDELVIGEVARFARQKNHIFYIDLANYLKENNIKAKIVLVGSGELKNNLEIKIKESKLEDYFILTGIRNDINIFMNMFDVFCMPSIYEGFPVSVIESIASGTPCVLSDTISDETSLVDDMVYYVNLNEDISKWYETIKNCIEKDYDKKYACKILREKGYNIDDVCKKIQEIYLKGERND